MPDSRHNLRVCKLMVSYLLQQITAEEKVQPASAISRGKRELTNRANLSPELD